MGMELEDRLAAPGKVFQPGVWIPGGLVRMTFLVRKR